MRVGVKIVASNISFYTETEKMLKDIYMEQVYVSYAVKFILSFLRIITCLEEG